MAYPPANISTKPLGVQSCLIDHAKSSWITSEWLPRWFVSSILQVDGHWSRTGPCGSTLKNADISDLDIYYCILILRIVTSNFFRLNESGKQIVEKGFLFRFFLKTNTTATANYGGLSPCRLALSRIKSPPRTSRTRVGHECLNWPMSHSIHLKVALRSLLDTVRDFLHSSLIACSWAHEQLVELELPWVGCL